MRDIDEFDEMADEAADLTESVTPGSGDRVRRMMSEVMGEVLAARAGAPGDLLARLDDMVAKQPVGSPLIAMAINAREAIVRNSKGGS